MSLTLLTKNLLELATSVVTVSPAADATKPLSRIYDRDRSVQYAGGSAAQTDIDADLGTSAGAATAWAMFTHVSSGVTVTLFGEAATPPTVSRDTIAAVGADFLRTFGTQTLRYWRTRIPAMAVVPKAGELFLGAHYTLPEPSYGSEEEQDGNVRRVESPGGYVWKSQKGSPRYRLSYRWDAMSDADWVSLKAAYDETLQSTKAFPMLDNDGTVRWVEFVDGSLRRQRLFLNQNVVTVAFLEAL